MQYELLRGWRMDYSKDILNSLVDMYERREGYIKEHSSLRAIQIDIKKNYTAYVDRYDHNAYKDINAAIEKLISEGVIISKLESTGVYSNVRLNIDRISDCYKRLNRKSIPEQCEYIKQILSLFENDNYRLLNNIISDWMNLAVNYRKLPYDLKYDGKRLKDVLTILEAVFKIEQESYIRNFSTAVFKDSKRFQKEFKSCIESILFDYTDDPIEKDKILEYYNLYENPTYVYIKGDMVISFDNSTIYANELPDGIALSNASLKRIKNIKVLAKAIITVENLTTYHDENKKEAVYIYLGGYHNKSKKELLEKIYKDNRFCEYLHEGDIDIYGFLILENLKERTGIPFKPLLMDVNTLKRCYEAGIYKELNISDIRMIEKNRENLKEYSEVLDFMLLNNCKVEQESLRAIELLE